MELWENITKYILFSWLYENIWMKYYVYFLHTLVEKIPTPLIKKDTML